MKRKIASLILLGIMFVVCLFGAVAFAEENATAVSVADLDATNVLSDLMTADNFDVDEYSFLQGENAPQLLSFVEYCYSPIANYSGLYRLYLYLYNPGGYVLASEGHTVTLATTYLNGNPTQYETFDLALVNISTNLDDKSTYNMFWKFRIVDRKSDYDNLTIQERVNSTHRQYDIAGIQLVSIGGNNVVTDTRVRDFTIGCSYTFRGYADGMSNTSTELLSVTCNNLDTVTLDVNSTYYRTETSDKGVGYHYDVNSVYFALPKNYLDGTTYDTLQRIKAEWYEFVTQDIVVTSNKSFYDTAISYVGMNKDSTSFENLQWGLVFSPLMTNDYSFACYPSTATWSWGKKSYYGDYWSPIDSLNYLFFTDSISNYDSSLPLLQQGGVSADALANYIYNYPFETDQLIEIDGKKYNKRLFQSTISDDRLVDNAFGVVQCGFDGKSVYDFDVDCGVLSYQTWDWSTGSYWDNMSMLKGDKWAWWNALWGNFPEQEVELNDIEYFVTVLSSDVNKLSKTDFCNKYLVNTYDYDCFVAYCQTEWQKNNEVILFRFAVTDYYSDYVGLYDSGGRSYPEFFSWYNKEAYRSYGSVFLNFDVIQLTFRKGNDYIAMGVVSDPIDIFPDIQPPTQIEVLSSLDQTWVRVLTLLFTVALILLVTFVVIGFVKYLIRK